MAKNQNPITSGVQNSTQPPITIINSQNGIAIGDQQKPSTNTQPVRDYSAPDWWMIIPTVFIAAATIALWWVGDQQRRAMIKQAGYMEAQLTELQGQNTTAQIAAQAAKTNADATIFTSRAYVAMSPQEPGLAQVHADDNVVSFQLGVQVHNWGKTPATLTRVNLRHFISDQLPPLPPYDDVPIGDSSVFLVADGNIFYHPTYTVSRQDFALIQAGARRLWLIGYVDYTDVFNEMHRGGFARVLAPNVGPNNLLFEARRGYNYDRKLTNEERQQYANSQ